MLAVVDTYYRDGVSATQRPSGSLADFTLSGSWSWGYIRQVSQGVYDQ